MCLPSFPRSMVIAMAGLLTIGLLLCACSFGTTRPEESAPLATPVQKTHQAPGSIVNVRHAVAGSLGETELTTYRSTDGATGAQTEVSAALFVPKGSPPQGGWPVVAVAHGTTGVVPNCGPTYAPSSLGAAGPVAELLARGYAVTVTDYQGLGIAAENSGATIEHPAHPYLEPRSAAYDLADSVRALRNLHPGQISTRWAAAGHSQGGQASWAATELAASYAPELQLVAALAMAPAVNLTQIAGIGNGTSIPADRAWIMPDLITGLSVSNPKLDRWDFLRGQVREQLDTLLTCDPAQAQRQEQAEKAINPADVAPADSAAMAALTQTLTAYTLPQRGSRVPLYVMQGTSDKVVPESSTTAAVKGACKLGAPVSYHKLPGRDHNIGDDMSGYLWLDKMMHGGSPDSTC